MFPPYSGNKVLTDAWLLDHQQMVQREVARRRWIRVARPTAKRGRGRSARPGGEAA